VFSLQTGDSSATPPRSRRSGSGDRRPLLAAATTRSTTRSISPRDFPGQDSISTSAATECLGERFTTYVGITYNASALDVFPVTPTEASWAEGDRTVYCAAFNLDLSKLTGSVQGTNR
jgi:hypothetical protein